MCRLFALRADSPRSVFQPLWAAPNALARQSTEHPDGWGIAHLKANRIQVLRKAEAAHDSAAFRNRARDVRSELVVAHIRKASVGSNTVVNTHPFRHAGWVFAHNGTVRKFDERRRAVEKRIAPKLRSKLEGDTDSERCFLLFLTELGREARGDVLERAGRALARVAAYTRETDPPGVPRPSVANFIATDGDALLALRYGKALHVSAPGTTVLREGSTVRELWISSEPTDRRGSWRKLAHGQGVALDRRMRLHRFQAS
ncbi:MAG: class II glutamine amidotransferase [Deltaproteobacteria bacterium]|nr:class II glutamine amidotransferase [Deltaproteobacteria bacterium]